MHACPKVGNQARATESGQSELARAPLSAVIVVDPELSELPIASLTVLDRLVVSLARAGVGRILLVGQIGLTLSRSTAMGIQVEHTDVLPTLVGPVLVGCGNVLATVADLRNLIANHGRLVTCEGQRLPLGILDGLSADWPAQLDQASKVVAKELAALVTSRDSARCVEQAYWASLTSSSDGWVDRHFNRPVGRWLSKALTGSPITPNQVSVVATLVGLVSAGLFTVGTAGTALAGALVLQLSAILDCVDGDLARALYKQSTLGKWLDIVGDQVVHVGVFLGLGIGLWRSGSTAPVLPLAIVAGVGVILSFLIVLRVLLHPKLRGRGRLQKLIDATTNRDFSVLLILFAFFGVLDWFLWLAAVGTHVFWVLAAALQFQEQRDTPNHARTA